MLEQIIFTITMELFNGIEPDKELLEQYFGSYGIADEIVAGITRAVLMHNDDARYNALRGYEG